ncbi:hypothetical protein BOQ62_12445 [Chryseobacterium sp. CH21]|uniref:hypothetical protein n=1 Tax=Chryseobacterium sp. CH21 TaxID=713556 RepID=UPI00100A3ED5|nr:hypothetical protein [Chryseobacterium sp. CH21]RXM39298.1 hypothetical protein BOQ62_12445 [Chryseobacterium sp. CH21]
MLLFIFVLISKINAQGFYHQEGTTITILENTTFYITDSGVVNEKRLKNLKRNASISHKTENIALNKKSKTFSKREKKTWTANTYKKRIKTEPRPEPIQGITTSPDNFFLNYQKGEAISASVTLHDYSGYSIDNKTFKFSCHFLNNDHDKVILKGFIFCKDSYFFQYKTRPPPSLFI